MNKYEELFKADPDNQFWGVEMLRDSLLPNLLDEDIHDILYWAGKELATQYPLASLEDLPVFFEQSKFGTLELKKADTQKVTWKLGGDAVKARLKLNKDPDFMLEAGFLAQTKQQIDQIATEADYAIKMGSTVGFNVVSDENEPIANPKDLKFIPIAK